MPSILFVLPWKLSAIGGVNQVVSNLARETAQHAHLRPIVLCNDWEQNAFTVGEHDGIMTVSGRLRAPVGDRRAMRNIASFAFRMRNDISAWRHFLKEQNIQVVNAHYATPGFLLFALMRALRRVRFRLIYSLHGADIGEVMTAGAPTRATMRWMLRQADHVVCSSNSATIRARQAFRLGENQVSTIYNGTNSEVLELARRHSYRPDTGAFDSYLVSVGRFSPEKGHDVLLDAYLQLVREGFKSSALVLIGQSTPFLSMLRSIARKSGLRDFVFFIPDLDHMRTLASIHKARLLVQPSREEPFGLPLLEAAYLRTPIVASSAGGIPEVLGGYYPYLAKPDDPKMLARCIDDALFNPTETERQVRLLKRRLPARFSWQNAYTDYERIWLSGQ